MTSLRTKLFEVFVRWLPFAVVTTIIFGTIYLAVQQDSAALIASGGPLSKLNFQPVAVDKSLAPFLIVYDQDGKITYASAILDGQVPGLPNEVLVSVLRNDESRQTWQPKLGVRIAMVVVPNSGNKGYVLAGQSLREV